MPTLTSRGYVVTARELLEEPKPADENSETRFGLGSRRPRAYRAGEIAHSAQGLCLSHMVIARGGQQNEGNGQRMAPGDLVLARSWGQGTHCTGLIKLINDMLMAGFNSKQKTNTNISV